MFPEQRGRSPNPHWRQRKPHGESGRAIPSNHGMLEFLQPLARANLLAVDEFTDGIQRGGSEMPALSFLCKFLRRKAADEFGESFRHHIRMRFPVLRAFPLRA